MGAGWRQLWSDVRCREAQDFNGHTPRRISIWSVGHHRRMVAKTIEENCQLVDRRGFVTALATLAA